MSEDQTSATAPLHALLWAYEWDESGCSVIADPAGIRLGTSTKKIWAHLRCDVEDAESQMYGFGLDQEVVEALAASETRPRMLSSQGGSLVVLRGINTNPNADPEDMVSLRIWFTESFIITARRHDGKLLSIEDVRATFEQNHPPKAIGEFMVFLVEKLADRISEMVESIDEELTHFETHLSDLPTHEVRPRLAALRRQAASIRRYLAPQRDALDAFYRHRGVLADDDAFALREHTDRTTRYVEDLDLARERAIVLQEELRNQIAEQQNVRMYVLSIVAAIFLPLSFLTGVFGMNVAGLPGTVDGNAFAYLASGMGLLALVSIIAMRWKKWL